VALFTERAAFFAGRVVFLAERVALFAGSVTFFAERVAFVLVWLAATTVSSSHADSGPQLQDLLPGVPRPKLPALPSGVGLQPSDDEEFLLFDEPTAEGL
jgi:hypothetical protein